MPLLLAVLPVLLGVRLIAAAASVPGGFVLTVTGLLLAGVIVYAAYLSGRRNGELALTAAWVMPAVTIVAIATGAPLLGIAAAPLALKASRPAVYLYRYWLAVGLGTIVAAVWVVSFTAGVAAVGGIFWGDELASKRKPGPRLAGLAITASMGWGAGLGFGIGQLMAGGGADLGLAGLLYLLYGAVFGIVLGTVWVITRQLTGVPASPAGAS